MSIFKRKQEEKEIIEQVLDKFEPIKQSEEEWIWVEGYKGTDKDMKCIGYQYELGKQYDIPDDEEVKICETGFHLCLLKKHVYSYYDIGNGNRFFKVKALVRKTDVDQYNQSQPLEINGMQYYVGNTTDKLVAKSIIFISECTRDEILKCTDAEDLPEKYKDIAIKLGVKNAVYAYRIDTLIKDGYSTAFASHIINRGLFDKAHAVGSQSDLSMDMKVLWILS